MSGMWRVARMGLMALAASIPLGSPMAAEKEYRIPVLSDFSGPFADVTKHLVTREAVVKWWNDTEGKKLGIRLTVKTYDTRYDGTVVASMWPGILSENQPIVVLGLGGADVAALQQRLPRDKVPVIYATPGYGFGWLPDQWLFNARATYVHEWSGALIWYAQQNPQKRPLRVGFLSTQASPAFVDFVKGTASYIRSTLEPKGLATVVATEWTEIQPVDVSSQMKKIIDAKADVIIGTASTAMAAAALRAQQLHGVSIPTLASPWHTIWPLAQAMRSYAPWEGHLAATGIVSILEKDSKAHQFYQTLHKNYGVPAEWNPLSLMGVSQSILMVRAVERAARKVGAANLTGSAMYDALLNGPFTEDELMGVSPGISFTREAPFPLKGGKIKVETVKDGKYVLATPQWVPIPEDIVKW